jgi:hypothetical protein
MKFLLIPFALVAAFEAATFALARIGERIARKRVPDEIRALKRRNAILARNRAPILCVAGMRSQSCPARWRPSANPRGAREHSTFSRAFTATSP